MSAKSIIAVIFIIAIVVLAIFLFFRNPFENFGAIDQRNITYTDIQIKLLDNFTKDQIQGNYIIRNSTGNIISSGTTSDTAWIAIKNVIVGNNTVFEAFKDDNDNFDYYKGTLSKIIEKNDRLELLLIREGEITSTLREIRQGQEFTEVIIEMKNTLPKSEIRYPLYCIAFFNALDASINDMKRTAVPEHLKVNADKCYSRDYIYSVSDSETITLKIENLDNESPTINLWVLDKAYYISNSKNIIEDYEGQSQTDIGALDYKTTIFVPRS